MFRQVYTSVAILEANKNEYLPEGTAPFCFEYLGLSLCSAVSFVTVLFCSVLFCFCQDSQAGCTPE